jgi:translation initiation factor 4G
MYFVPCGFTLVASPTTQSPTATFMLSTPPTKDESLVETTGSDEELPSVGSAGHADGSCKRCAFFPKGRCQNGKDCTHCHFDHSNRMRLRKRRQCRTSTKYWGMQESLLQDPAQSDEISSMRDSPCEDVEVSSTIDNDEVSNLESVYVIPGPHKEQKTSDGDCPSEDDMIDAATMAPSSSASDDERAPASRAASGQSYVGEAGKESVSEGSDSESVSSHGRATSTDAEQSDTISVASPKPKHTSCGLALSPTSWSAQLRARRADADGNNKEVPTAEIARMARALLNKLTRERFESLCGQILALPFSTPEQLAVLAAEIFEKATTQNGFRSLYTELCVRLDAHLMKQSSSVGGKAFRKALVKECQATFERHLQPADPSLFAGLTGDECFEVEMKLKTRRLGNMRFIGELLVQRLLAQKLMPPIVLQLLHGDEAALESLIALLTVVAPVFEQGTSLYKVPLRDAFATLQRKKNEPGISSRVHCHLSDLFDARAQGWATGSA